jgi:hypothetical protein
METNPESQRSPVRIRLQRGRCYNWEIQIHGQNVDEVLTLLKDADEKLRSQYGKFNAEA